MPIGKAIINSREEGNGIFLDDDTEVISATGAIAASSIANRGISRASYAFQTGAGAIPVTAEVVALTTTGADALTLADGVDGQILTITMITDGGDGTLTPDNPTGYSTITFNDALDGIQLLFVGGVGWAVLLNSGCTIA